MGEPRDPEPTIESVVDAALAERLALARLQYEAAFAAADAGGGPPTVQLDGLDDLDDLPELLRASCRRGLAALDAEYRHRAATRPDAPTLTFAVAENVPRGDIEPPEAEIGTEIDLRLGRPPGPVDAELPETVVGPAPPPAATVDFDGAARSVGADEFTLAGTDYPGRAVSRSRLPEIDGYEVIEELKKGGMGVVYKARQLGANRLVAIKMILAGIHADPDQIARFADDSRLAAQLDDPGIVKIYQIGAKDGLPFFSLEFVEGGSLADLILDKDRGGPRKPREAASLAEGMARSIQVAHDAKIIHRDLKPANVLLTRKGEPKITDFGLAKRLEGETPTHHTQTGQIMGTPSYMAPEQARGATHEIGPLADVYALGAILYELLTGRPPFQGATIWDTLDQVLMQEPVPPRRLQPKVPVDLETIALKCLQKEPHRRYGSAVELADDLARFLQNEPIKARPVSGPERAWRWCRRNPRLATLNAAIAVLLVGITIGSTTAAFYMRSLREDADAKRLLADNNANIAHNAQREADHNATLAAQQAGVALDTSRDLIKGVQTRIPDSVPGRRLKDDLLRAAGDQLRRVARTGENSTQMDLSMAAVYQKLGRLFDQVGDTTEALAQLEKAHEMTESFWERKPDDHDLTFGLSGVKNDLADLYFERLRDFARARSLYARSLELRLSLLAKTPSDEGMMDNAATSHGLLAKLALASGDLAEARREFDEETKLRDAFSPATANFLPRLRKRAGQYDQLSGLFLQFGDFTAARTYADAAMKLRREYADAEAEPGVRRDLALSCANLADLNLRDPAVAGPEAAARAEALCREAIAILKPILKDDPAGVENAFTLGLDYYRLGLALLVRQPSEATVAFAEARDQLARLVERAPNLNTPKVPLLLARARCGEHAAAASALAERFKAMPNPPVGDLYDIACGFAACASTAPRDLAAADAAQAVAVLRKAQSLGWKNLVDLQTDPDLASIRDCPEYARLVADLKAAGATAVAGRK